MGKTRKVKNLVELTLNEDKNSEFPKLVLAVNNEPAINPQILSNVAILKYFGCTFASFDGSDFRETAIRQKAPSNANAYFGKGCLSQRGIVGGNNYSAVVYFHIDEEQANNAPNPEKRLRSHGDFDHGYDGDNAD